MGDDTSETPALGDIQITGLNIPSIKPAPVFTSGAGHLAIVTVGPDGSAAQQVWLTVMATGSTTVKTQQLTSTVADPDGSTTDYNIGSVWYEDGDFYVTYVKVTADSDGNGNGDADPTENDDDAGSNDGSRRRFLASTTTTYTETENTL